MTKTINTTAAILSVALFSGAAAAATPDLEGDIVHGNGQVASSPSTPYIQVDSGPKGTETDLMSNLHEVEQSNSFTPYVKKEGDRDNHDDLIDQV